MALPLFQTNIRELSMLETQWKSQIDPILANPLNNPSILKNISLINGATVINHLLGKTQQGWAIIDVNAAATIYRSAAFNDLTLTLTSSAACIVNLMVF